MKAPTLASVGAFCFYCHETETGFNARATTAAIGQGAVAPAAGLYSAEPAARVSVCLVVYADAMRRAGACPGAAGYGRNGGSTGVSLAVGNAGVHEYLSGVLAGVVVSGVGAGPAASVDWRHKAI